MAPLGDAAHCFMLLNTTTFMVCVILHAFQYHHLFSASWSTDGFCITHKTDAVTVLGVRMPISSHALCFYSDIVFAVALFLLSRTRKNESSMKPVVDAAPGIFGHGIAHLGLWAAGDASSLGPSILASSEPAWKLISSVVGVSVFFYLFFRGFSSLSRRAVWTHSLFHGAVTALAIPPRFGFTYVQTALMLVYSYAELKRPSSEKDAYFDAYAWLVGVPVGFVGWMESIGCDTFIRRLGGHVVYDTSISLSILAYFLLAWGRILDAPKLKTR
jgi:hypothetical protein